MNLHAPGATSAAELLDMAQAQLAAVAERRSDEVPLRASDAVLTHIDKFDECTEASRAACRLTSPTWMNCCPTDRTTLRCSSSQGGPRRERRRWLSTCHQCGAERQTKFILPRNCRTPTYSTTT